MLQAVASGSKKKDGVIPTAGVAVKLDVRRNVYFLAVNFATKPDGPGTVGLWASPTLEPSGELSSVDGTAKIFTKWPDSGDEFSRQQINEDGRLASSCVDYIYPPSP